jgi:hypothetical protein
MKTYSAQSGYVYQYFYEGQRTCRSGNEDGAEYVFHISADRRTWTDASVHLAAAAIAAWQQSHGRELSSTERYAIAKMALFQAFDERSAPAEMAAGIRVRTADIEGIVETLDL